jgi:hypothetical protein
MAWCLINYVQGQFIIIVIIILIAKVVGKDFDIFAIGAVSVSHIYTHQHKIVHNICS